MSKEKVDVMVEGGKASAGAAMGQAFGPLGVDMKAILDKINEATAEFKGMKIPVTVIVDTETKEFELEIGTPPVSELIKKELNIQKGSGKAAIEKVGNLAIEQIIKISKMKESSLIVNNLKSAVKSVIGSCGAMGVLVEGKEPLEINPEIDSGKYDKEINEGKTETAPKKLQKLKDQLAGVKSELEKEAKELEKAEEEEKAAAEEAAVPAEDEVPKEGEEAKEGEVKEGEEAKEEKKPEEKKEEKK